MGNFKGSLAKGVKEKRKFTENQNRLKEKHKIDSEEDKIIVEKSNMAKWTINKVIAFFKLSATIIIVILATIGLLGIIYPAPRNSLIEVIKTTYEQILSFF